MGIGFLPIRDIMNPFMACESRIVLSEIRSTAAR
jgi:hypothetical protein